MANPVLRGFWFWKRQKYKSRGGGVDGDESLVTQPKRRPWFGGLDRRKTVQQPGFFQLQELDSLH